MLHARQLALQQLQQPLSFWVWQEVGIVSAKLRQATISCAVLRRTQLTNMVLQDSQQNPRAGSTRQEADKAMVADCGRAQQDSAGCCCVSSCVCVSTALAALRLSRLLLSGCFRHICCAPQHAQRQVLAPAWLMPLLLRR